MTVQLDDQIISRKLLQFGVLLFLLGLSTGLLMPVFENPRMGLASHLEGILNGMFLISLGLFWQRLYLKSLFKKVTLALVIYGTFANWFATLMAAIWGAGSMMTIASAGYEGAAWQEILITTLLFTLSFAMLAVCGLLLYGLRSTSSAEYTSVNELKHAAT